MLDSQNGEIDVADQTIQEVLVIQAVMIATNPHH